MAIMDRDVEEGLIKLVTKELKPKLRLELKKYQKSHLFVHSPEIIQQILKTGEFKDVGNIYDYPKLFSRPSMVSGYDLTANFENFQRIAVSKKLNTAIIYNFQEWSYYCVFFIDVKKIKKFAKLTKPIIQQDISQINIFQDIDFKCKEAEYIEVSNSKGNDAKPVNAVKKKVTDENLVFEKDSTITEVIKDITDFFTENSKKEYERMEIAYKRGSIVYGPPGTGKTAGIREVIRSVDSKVSKIVISPNVRYDVTDILTLLLRALNGKPAIIVIEDMDSLINEENRSEFLNILDGADVKSGCYIIGTTNYPERIDPAFVNRSGRFDRSFEIGNPSHATRKLFYESKNLKELFATDEDIAELFAKYSEGLPMASLKEVILAAKYTKANNTNMSIEEVIKTASGKLMGDKIKHINSHKGFKKKGGKKNKKNKGGSFMSGFDDLLTNSTVEVSSVNSTEVANNDESDDEDDTSKSSEIGYIRIVKKDDADVVFAIIP